MKKLAFSANVPVDFVFVCFDLFCLLFGFCVLCVFVFVFYFFVWVWFVMCA